MKNPTHFRQVCSIKAVLLSRKCYCIFNVAFLFNNVYVIFVVITFESLATEIAIYEYFDTYYLLWHT